MGDNYFGGHHCLVCEKAITWQFAICTTCEQTYGRTSSEWPAWLSFLWRDQVRQRRRNKTIARREVTVSDLTFNRLVEYQENSEEVV